MIDQDALKGDTRANAGARAALKRQARKWAQETFRDRAEQTVPHWDAQAVGIFAYGHPEYAARAFVACVERSAKAYAAETAENSAEMTTRHLWAMEDAERVAAIFGAVCDWPGLYPTLSAEGVPELYETGDAGTVCRWFRSIITHERAKMAGGAA